MVGAIQGQANHPVAHEACEGGRVNGDVQFWQWTVSACDADHLGTGCLCKSSSFDQVPFGKLPWAWLAPWSRCPRWHEV